MSTTLEPLPNLRFEIPEAARILRISRATLYKRTGFAASSRWVPHWFPVVPFVGFAAVVLLVLLWIRCPRCDSPVGQNVGALNGKDRFYRRRVNLCAHCVVSFDEPYS